MPLSQDQLEAFAAVARTGSFTRAATVLHLSQPALSRRITALEARLDTMLLVRGRTGASLTESGRRLLDFVEAQRALEEELVGDLSPAAPSLRGVVRLAGVSSLVPPVVLPALAPLLHAHPAVQIEIYRELDVHAIQALTSSRVDFALSQNASALPGIVDVHLGDEEFVMIESRVHRTRRDVFLDVGAGDITTELFLAIQPDHLRPRGRLTRSFMYDEPGILLAVELGIGRAVKPRHTITRQAAVRVDPRYLSLVKPVYLHYRRQPHYSRLHGEIVTRIEAAVRERLAKRRVKTPRRTRPRP